MTDKMNIEKNSQVLKLYMFTIQTGLLQIEVPESFKAVLAYNDTDAVNMVRKDYTETDIISIKKRAQVEVTKIIDIVDVELFSPKELKVRVPITNQKDTTAQEFIYGMMLVADTFIKNKQDRIVLKQIINKLKRYENKRSVATKQNIA